MLYSLCGCVTGRELYFLNPTTSPSFSECGEGGGGGSELWFSASSATFVFWWDHRTVSFQISPAGRVTKIRGRSEGESLFSCTVCKASRLLIPVSLSCWETIGNDRVKNNEIKACRQKRLILLCPLVRSDIARNLLRWHFGLRVNRSRSLIPTAIWKMRWGDFSACCEIRPFLPLDDVEPSMPECGNVIREGKTKEQIFRFKVLLSSIPFFKRRTEGFKNCALKLPLARVSLVHEVLVRTSVVPCAVVTRSLVHFK